MEDTVPRMKSVKKMYEDLTTAPARPSLAHDTKAMSMADKMFATPKAKKMASGGSASSRADGCAQRGKTRGRVV
jgi:hypothetical protein